MPDKTSFQEIDMLGVSVVVKRADLNHSVVQGNKLWKLKYNLRAAQKQHSETLVTFGGAYSNHLLATAYVAAEAGLKSVGVVRGDELQHNPAVWSETLHRCQKYGMRLVFVNRQQYRSKQDSEPFVELMSSLKHPYVIPEGGSNQLAVKGVAEWVCSMSEQLEDIPSHMICPVGTGGTLAGLIAGVTAQQWNCQLMGVVVLKALPSIRQHIIEWTGHLDQPTPWELIDHCDGGGYAKTTEEMSRFAVGFTQKHGIPLDKIYNVKSFYALAQLIKTGQITANDRPFIIHTGGLQAGIV